MEAPGSGGCAFFLVDISFFLTLQSRSRERHATPPPLPVSSRKTAYFFLPPQPLLLFVPLLRGLSLSLSSFYEQ